MIFLLKRLERNSPEIQEFHDRFCEGVKYDIPVGYFNKGDCFTMTVRGKMVAGFCLVNEPPLNLRSLRQIEDIVRRWHIYENTITDVCEFTGYFIEDKRFAFFFTLYLVWSVLWCNAKQFVYSYPVSQKSLERYYSYGKPLRLSTGIPEHLKHLPGIEEEHVELLSKWGIVKIFLHRTRRYFLRSYYGKRTRS